MRGHKIDPCGKPKKTKKVKKKKKKNVITIYSLLTEVADILHTI